MRSKNLLLASAFVSGIGAFCLPASGADIMGSNNTCSTSAFCTINMPLFGNGFNGNIQYITCSFTSPSVNYVDVSVVKNSAVVRKMYLATTSMERTYSLTISRQLIRHVESGTSVGLALNEADNERLTVSFISSKPGVNVVACYAYAS